MSIEAPRGFARATGTVEARYLCRACHRPFPTLAHEDATCPHCGSRTSRPLSSSDRDAAIASTATKTPSARCGG